MGSGDSIVVLLLVPEVDKFVLVSDPELLPVDVRLDDKSEVAELGPVDKVEEPADVEKSESELIEVEISSLEADETPAETEAVIELDRLSVDEAVKLALESEVIDWDGADVRESSEVLGVIVPEVKRDDEVVNELLEVWRSLAVVAAMLELGVLIGGSVLEVESVLVEIVGIVEAAKSVELDESKEDIPEEGSVVGLEELVKESRSVEPNESTEDVLEARSVLAESEEPIGLDESADVVVERLADDEESISVLNTLEILVSVELMGMKESELVPETVALEETSVGGFDALAVALEVLILDRLSVVDNGETPTG